jgi:hypothetical protein
LQKVHENSTNKLIKNINKNNTYEMEDPNARGVVNNLEYHVYQYLCHDRPLCLGNSILAFKNGGCD